MTIKFYLKITSIREKKANFARTRRGQLFTLLTSDKPSYDLLGLNVKIPDKPPSSHILNKKSGPTYGEHEETLIHILDKQETDFYHNEGEFQWAKRNLAANGNSFDP